jgi:membrane protease subunit (stomatin/prohibitin family)
VTVRSDETAVFFKDGKSMGILEAGVYSLDSRNIPFLTEWLVSPMTGGNYCVTELFFVRRSEILHGTGSRELGSFSDVGTQLLVTLFFQARFGLQVHQPVTLIETLAGQRVTAGGQVEEWLNGRVGSLMSAVVGQIMATAPVMQVVSNQYSEQIGQFVIDNARHQFDHQGLRITRFVDLRLQLSGESRQELNKISHQRATLAVEREEMELARDPGYVRYHLVKGQRAMLEGIGKGAASGAGMAMMALPPLMAPLPQPVVTPSFRAENTPLQNLGVHRPRQLTTSQRYFLRLGHNMQGPYNKRQLILHAEALGVGPSEIEIRQEGSTNWQILDEIDELAEAWMSRPSQQDKPRSSGQPASQGFESALKVALQDGELSNEALALLVSLACASGLAVDAAAARAYVISRARACGAKVPESEAEKPKAAAPPPIPVGPPVFSYSNGIQQLDGLTAEAIARRVQALPDGVHLVWRTGMDGWKSASEVEEIASLL